MIILDTSVISETMRPKPNRGVLAWLDRQAPKNLFLTSISIAEMKYGADTIPKGRRRMALQAAVQSLVNDDFRGRILAFDQTAALLFGEPMASAKAQGFAVGQSDAMIASIVLAQKNCSIATRDTAPFEVMEVKVINPWKT